MTGAMERQRGYRMDSAAETLNASDFFAQGARKMKIGCRLARTARVSLNCRLFSARRQHCMAERPDAGTR